MNHRFDELVAGLAQSITRCEARKQSSFGLVLAICLSATLSTNAASFSDTGSLKDALAYHTATLLPNGKVLVAGGENYNNGGLAQYLLRAELYDPTKGKWTATGDLNTRRSHHTATLLPNGMVLVAGGENNSSNYTLSKSELYDPTTGTWTNTGALKSARSDHTATLLANGKVLVVGGYGLTNVLSSAEIYDPTTGKWTLTGSHGP